MRRTIGRAILAGMLIFFMTATMAGAADDPPRPGFYLDLSEAFYSSLALSDDVRVRSLSTGMNEEYLRQIAVATRYLVETNLELLRQQQRLLELLEAQRSRPSSP